MHAPGPCIVYLLEIGIPKKRQNGLTANCGLGPKMAHKQIRQNFQIFGLPNIMAGDDQKECGRPNLYEIKIQGDNLPNGENYERYATEKSQSLYRQLVDKYSQEADKIRQEFGDKYGWGEVQEANVNEGLLKQTDEKLPNHLLE